MVPDSWRGGASTGLFRQRFPTWCFAFVLSALNFLLFDFMCVLDSVDRMATRKLGNAQNGMFMFWLLLKLTKPSCDSCFYFIHRLAGDCRDFARLDQAWNTTPRGKSASDFEFLFVYSFVKTPSSLAFCYFQRIDWFLAVCPWYIAHFTGHFTGGNAVYNFESHCRLSGGLDVSSMRLPWVCFDLLESVVYLSLSSGWRKSVLLFLWLPAWGMPVDFE